MINAYLGGAAVFEAGRTLYRLQVAEPRPQMMTRRAITSRRWPALYSELREFKDERRPFLLMSEKLPAFLLSVAASPVLFPLHVWDDVRRAEIVLRGLNPKAEGLHRRRAFQGVLDFVLDASDDFVQEQPPAADAAQEE